MEKGTWDKSQLCEVMIPKLDLISHSNDNLFGVIDRSYRVAWAT
jgi:hypothetical protein